MTEPSRYAALAARVLRERPVAKESRLCRDMGIGVVANAMELGRRRRRNLRFAALALGVAAAAAIALAVGVPRTAPVAACHGASCAGVSAQAPDASRHGLDAGQSIVAPAGAPTSLVLASGTQIALDAKSVLECREDTATQRFALLRGGAHLHVSKLRDGERFVVDTPNAEVEVRGTVFGVRIDPATTTCRERTSVAVEEGRVEVRAAGATAVLVHGEHWTSDCAPPADATAPAPKRTTAASAAPAAARVRSPAAAPSAEVSRRASALREQNDLYAQAEAARRGGHTGDALGAYSHLLASFPNGQLAESALVERVRLLDQRDHASARKEAERYLARYPAGFARSEMEALSRAP